uniref:Ribosomal protein S6 kinase-related protein n=1 Tax=Phallusia mammillata TaxID=59560 RepID=A0A6F9DS26_9ASCI|nr:ribosomal protein S6 kinase-related protein [Phallusia mammillata]
MEKQFVWRQLTESDMDEAKRFVYQYYSKQLPLAKIFRVKDEEMRKRNLEQTELMIKNGTSYGCFQKLSGKFAAIIQCSVLLKDEAKTKLKCEENCSAELSALSRFVGWMLKDIFTDLNAEKLLVHCYGAVADEFKRNGLLDTAGDLTKKSALRLGCEYEVGLVVNAYAGRAAANQKEPVFTIREITFRDYVDPETGMKPNLELLPVHTYAKTVYRKVHPSTSCEHSSKL